MAALVYALVRNRPSEMGLPPVMFDREQVAAEMSLMEGIKLVVTSGRFWPIAIWAFCVFGISFAIGGLWGGPYLMQVYGLSKTAAGGVLSTFALALIFGSPLLSWFANWFGRKPVLISCSLVLIVVCGLMSWFVDRMALPTLYIIFFCFFLAGGAGGPVIAAVSKELFPIAISGTSVATVNLFPFIGAAVFQVLIGAVLTAGSHGQTEYAMVGFRYMFLICLTAAALSLAVAFLLKETLSATENS
jgi:MFS family permease